MNNQKTFNQRVWESYNAFTLISCKNLVLSYILFSLLENKPWMFQWSEEIQAVHILASYSYGAYFGLMMFLGKRQ